MRGAPEQEQPKHNEQIGGGVEQTIEERVES